MRLEDMSELELLREIVRLLRRQTETVYERMNRQKAEREEFFRQLKEATDR